MQKQTTARIDVDDMEWIFSCMENRGVKSVAKFIKLIRKEAKRVNNFVFYEGLPYVGRKQPLKGKCIQNEGAAYK